MSSTKDKDYDHANDRGNGPKERMEGGDQTDDIDINDPETRKKHLEGIKQQEKNSTRKK
jgi:hypothetical protein